MNLDAVTLCIILSLMFVTLIKEWLLPEITVFFALSSVILFGIMTPSEALLGFSNPNVHTLVFLYILGSAVSKSGIFNDLFVKLLNQSKSIQQVLFRLMLPVSALSAFINNTPIVTILIPIIKNWASSKNIKPSKLLIPLSYAAILGGTITLIGTSTNLLIQGLLQENQLEGVHFFDFAYFGIPLTFAGILYFVFIGHRLLPERKPNREMYQEEQHKHIYKFLVMRGSPLIGKTILEAALRNLNQFFLIQIIRGNKIIIPAPNDEIIRSDDILVFSGNPETFFGIYHALGLKPYKDEHEENSVHSPINLYEVGIPSNSPLLNKRIKESYFRSKYNAVILAIKRKNTQITSGIGNIMIKPGDILLLLTKNDFNKSWGDSDDFYFISPINQNRKKSNYQKMIIIGLIIGIFIASILQLTSIFILALLSTIILIITKVLTVSSALRSINWNIVILMGSSIGIGKAVEKTGLAKIISNLLMELPLNLGVLGILLLFYFVTTILTEILNNLATAAIMFPIGFNLSQQLGTDPIMFAMITAIAASCSFLTPIGYQTNLLVYGPGGYKFFDYLIVGLPLSLICMGVSILLAYLKWL